MADVVLDDVTKIYDGSILAVDKLSLEIEDGEFLVLVGPSGCGKSSTLRMVAGLETISDGTISIGGERANEKEPRERDIGMVFQNYALYPHMNVRENIGFGLRYSSNLSRSEIDQRVQEVVEMMGIEELLDDRPGQLSGGQRQRVALGRAIVRNPQVFLFDEPLSNLDAKLRTQMRTELSRLQHDLGVTSMYVTHNQEEAMTMSDRLAVMNEGRFDQVGPPGDVYDEPDSRFVADFLGTANIFDGSVTALGDGLATVDSDGAAISSRSGAETAVGDEVAVVIRPERFRFVSGTPDGGRTEVTENVFEGEITFTRHLGSSVEFRLETAAGRELVVVHRSGLEGYEPGDEVTVSVDADDCRLVSQ